MLILTFNLTYNIDIQLSVKCAVNKTNAWPKIPTKTCNKQILYVLIEKCMKNRIFMSLSYLKNNFLVTSNTRPTSNMLVILLFMNTAHAQYLLSVSVLEVDLKLSIVGDMEAPCSMLTFLLPYMFNEKIGPSW